MSLVLVLTVASLALTDAGYQYNAPGAILGLPGKQSANLHSGHISQHHTALPNEHDKPLSHSISYKDFVYLKQDNGQNIGNHGSVNHGTSNSGIDAAPSVQATAGPIENNGYVNAGYAQSFAPASTVDLNNNYVQNYAPVHNHFNSGHIQKLLPITSGNANSGYSQTSSLSGSNGNIGYAQNPISSSGGILNTVYSQTSSAPAVYNNGYTHTSVPPINNNFGNDQTFTPSANTNLNAGYSNGWVPVNSGLTIQTAGSNLNTGYSQTLMSSDSASLSNTYSTSSASSILNAVYSQPLAPSGATSYNNNYAQTSIPSASGNIINDYSQVVATSGSGHSNLNTGGNLDSGYSQTSIAPIGTHLNTANAQPIGAPVSSSLNNAFAQTSTKSFKVNLNPTSTFDFSINSSNIQTSTGSSNLNIGFTQTGSNNNFNGNANTVSVPSGAPITPAVFKHIYFHVPSPEVEEQNVILPPPVKKNYKILFIKVASQEPNLGRLKQIAQMTNAAASVEHKTLIYVLVENPEAQQPPVIPNRTPSEHEVFFVKYNGNPLDLAAQVNTELDKSGTLQSIDTLEPGLLNGKKRDDETLSQWSHD